MLDLICDLFQFVLSGSLFFAIIAYIVVSDRDNYPCAQEGWFGWSMIVLFPLVLVDLSDVVYTWRVRKLRERRRRVLRRLARLVRTGQLSEAEPDESPPRRPGRPVADKFGRQWVRGECAS